MADGSAVATELIYGFVDEIRLTPVAGTIRIELRGELAAILRLAGGTSTNGRRRDAAAVGELAEQVKMVAGTGFEPVTFRL